MLIEKIVQMTSKIAKLQDSIESEISSILDSFKLIGIKSLHSNKP